MLFLWMVTLFIALVACFKITDFMSSFDERQRYYQLKGYQLAIAGVFAIATVLFFVEERPAWLDFRNSLFLIMVGGVIPFIVYSIWHDAYFKSRKKPWEEILYILAVLLIELLAWKVISSAHFNLKTNFPIVMQAIWFGVAGLNTVAKLVVRYFEEKE